MSSGTFSSSCDCAAVAHSGTTLNLLKFPIINPTPYRMFRRRRRLDEAARQTESELPQDELRRLRQLSRQGYLLGETPVLLVSTRLHLSSPVSTHLIPSPPVQVASAERSRRRADPHETRSSSILTVWRLKKTKRQRPQVGHSSDWMDTV